MNPLYSLTPISDHAKELLKTIDTAREKQQEPNRNDKHETFSEVYGRKPGEPAYTEGQVKGLESMYGYNKSRLVDVALKKGPLVKSYNRVSLIIAEEHLDKFHNVLFDECIIEAIGNNIVDHLVAQGCKFRNCKIIHQYYGNEAIYLLHKE